MIDYPRPKTGISRRCPLWPETVAATPRGTGRPPRAEERRTRRLGVHHQVRRFRGRQDTTDGPAQPGNAEAARRLGINGRKGLGLLHLAAHLPNRRRRGEGPAGRRLHHGPRGRAHEQRVPRDDQRRAAEGRHRPRSQVAVRRAIPEVVPVSRWRPRAEGRGAPDCRGAAGGLKPAACAPQRAGRPAPDGRPVARQEARQGPRERRDEHRTGAAAGRRLSDPCGPGARRG